MIRPTDRLIVDAESIRCATQIAVTNVIRRSRSKMSFKTEANANDDAFLITLRRERQLHRPRCNLLCRDAKGYDNIHLQGITSHLFSGYLRNGSISKLKQLKFSNYARHFRLLLFQSSFNRNLMKCDISPILCQYSVSKC